MDRPILPLEIRSRIYVELGDVHLAEEIPEVFWALCPELFRVLQVGQILESPESLQTNKLITLYPNSGNFVEKLTIITDLPSQPAILGFLKAFPKHRKLRELFLVLSFEGEVHFHLDALLYGEKLQSVVLTSPQLRRLSFNGFQPSPELINACHDRLTRLDVTTIHTTDECFKFPLPSHLEILSFTPRAVPLFLGLPPETLRRIIIKARMTGVVQYWDECCEFIAKCTFLESLGLEERCTFFFLLSSSC